MAHSEGELATSKACAKAGVNMGISSYANYRIDQIREAGLSVGPIDHAMQLYTMKDRDLELRIIQEAEKQGCKAIFLTADSPVLGVRFNEWRNDFRTPEGFSSSPTRKSDLHRMTTHSKPSTMTGTTGRAISPG
jgi:(S)-2-hydroxy-acid oxidase